MFHSIIAFSVAVVAVFIAYRTVRMLWSSSWFMGWLRGMFGLGLLTLALAIGLLAYDIHSYKSIPLERPVASVSIESIASQHFKVTLVERSGREQSFNLFGDQWQLDARLLKAQGLLALISEKPAYRLDRLSGRFYDIHKETAENRVRNSIVQSWLGLDVWKFIDTHPAWFPYLETSTSNATYLPMSGGALYEIYISNIGLVARPLNDAAEKAAE
ncbi:MAG TPA: cation/multidrug efflux pump [Cellvibrio sp.]|nr:cation/multidrug efflux pump [Cellvibrio sp.]